jgi:DNA-binding response OmpR family regulator
MGLGTILVVEDNEDLAFGLRYNLEAEGYTPIVVVTGGEALANVDERSPDLVVLDLSLPDVDGFRILETIRRRGHTMPVMILTSRGDEVDKVRGLRLGADDYLTKPFSLLEFIARIEALLRRGTRRDESTAIVGFGVVTIDPAKRTVTKDGSLIELAPLEFDLLMALTRRNGVIATRKELLKEVWGYSHDVESRTIDMHILELRRKLERDPANPRHILTVRKAGYRLQP